MYDIDASAFVNQVSDKTDYVLSGQQFYFYGLCPACQKKQQAQARN